MQRCLLHLAHDFSILGHEPLDWSPVCGSLENQITRTLFEWRQVRRSGTHQTLLLPTTWPQLLHLIPLMPGLQLLRHDLSGHQPDGVVRVLLQRRGPHQPGVRRRRLQDAPRGRRSLLPLSLLRAASHNRGGQEALPQARVLWRQGPALS